MSKKANRRTSAASTKPTNSTKTEYSKTHVPKRQLHSPEEVFTTRSGMSNGDTVIAELALRVDRALRTAVSCCDQIPELHGFDRPLAPVGLLELLSDFNDKNNVEIYDYLTNGYPWDYQDRFLLSMNWGGMCGGTLYYDVIRLADRTSVYFRSDDDGRFLIASTKPSNTSTADRIFLEALLRSNGTVFRDRMFGGVPTEFCTIANKRKLPELLYSAFEDACMDNNDEIWTDLAELVAQHSDRDADWGRLKSDREGRHHLLRKYVAKFA